MIAKEVVYICHKYRNDPYNNYLKVRQILIKLKRVFSDKVFLGVHLYLPHFFSDENNEQDQIKMYCLTLLSLCDKMIIFGEDLSDGMQWESDFCNKNVNAKGKVIEVIYADDELYNKIGIKKEFIEDE